MPKHEKNFANGYISNCPEAIFVNITWTYVISDVNDEQIVQTFYEKELRKLIRKNLKLEK